MVHGVVHGWVLGEVVHGVMGGTRDVRMVGGAPWYGYGYGYWPYCTGIGPTVRVLSLLYCTGHCTVRVYCTGHCTVRVYCTGYCTAPATVLHGYTVLATVLHGYTVPATVPIHPVTSPPTPLPGYH